MDVTSSAAATQIAQLTKLSPNSVTSSRNESTCGATCFGNASDGNTVEETEEESESALLMKNVTLALYSLIFTVSVVSNLLVVLVIILNKQLRTGGNVLILGLAAADILYSASGMMFTPLSLLQDSWFSGALLCMFIQMLAGGCVHSISYTTMFIAMDRIRTVASRKSLSVGSAGFINLAVWTFAMLLSLPMGLKTSISNNRCVERWDEQENALRYVYSLVYLFAPFVVPAIVITVCHARMTKFFEYRYRFARARAQSGEQRQILRHLQKKRRMSMLSLSIIICFIIFFTPLNIFNLVAEFSPELVESSPNSFTIFITAHLLTCASTVANPILYCCFNANFRRVCKTQAPFNRIFGKRLPRQRIHQYSRSHEVTII